MSLSLAKANDLIALTTSLAALTEQDIDRVVLELANLLSCHCDAAA